MKRLVKIAAIILGLLIVVIVAIPFLIDANTFRPRLESELTAALGRQAQVGNLSLSLLSGGVSADNISISDDPKFSKNAFIEAKSLRVGVEMMPLIFSKTLNVTEITLDQPQIRLIKSENGEKWNFSSLGGKNTAAAAPKPSTPASGNPNLSVAKLSVKDGKLTVSRAGSAREHVYDKVNIQVTNFSFASTFPFEMTADLPAGGTMKLDGHAGPIDADDAAKTPMDAKISVEKMKLDSSGFIDPAAGIAGVADLEGTVASDGREAKVNGTLKASNLVVVKKGSPAGRPVDLKFAVVHNIVKQDGSLTEGDISMGKAVAHLTGSYDLRGKVTAVNLKLNGQNMPVDDLEAMLPAVGVVLPPKATLKGGDLDLNMASSGPVDRLVTTGSLKLQNTQLANFDLGQKLAAISALTGKNTGGDTTIQNFSSDVKMTTAGTDASNINLTIPAIGVLTGAGTVSPANELAFKMNASVGGMGVPFGVTGTTSDPKFTPDVKGIASSFLKGALGNQGTNSQQNPVDSVMGLFKKKKPQPK